jgi:hypothetical protein
MLLIAVAGLGLAGGAVFAFLRWRGDMVPAKDAPAEGFKKFSGVIRTADNRDEKTFRLVVSPKWQMDNGIKTGLKANMALYCDEPSGDAEHSHAAWLAVAAKDFGTRKPRDAEMLKEGIDRLENHFGESLELAEKADVKELIGLRAQRLEFRGMVKQVSWRGECYTLFQHGIGYWFYIAAPTLEAAQQELADLQADKRGFVLIDERRGWREQPPARETFTGSKFPLSLSAPEGVWEKFPATDQDERGDLFLFGRYGKEKDNRKNASVLIIAMDQQPGLKEALKSARMYFEEKKKEEDKDYQTFPVTEGSDGINNPIGDRPGRLIDLRLQLGNEPKRYMLLAVADGSGQTFAVRCDCTWENRQIWREDFLDLLRTFKLRKK